MNEKSAELEGIHYYDDERWGNLPLASQIKIVHLHLKGVFVTPPNRADIISKRIEGVIEKSLAMASANMGLSFDKYQMKTHETAVFPQHMSVAYTAMGLGGEAGEVLNKVKKIYRDNNGQITPDASNAIGREIGGVLWYCSELATALGIRLADIASENLKDLAGRKDRGTIKGSGDDR